MSFFIVPCNCGNMGSGQYIWKYSLSVKFVSFLRRHNTFGFFWWISMLNYFLLISLDQAVLQFFVFKRFFFWQNYKFWWIDISIKNVTYFLTKTFRICLFTAIFYISCTCFRSQNNVHKRYCLSCWNKAWSFPLNYLTISQIL